MADDNSTEAAHGLITRTRNEDGYTSALQLARQLNASPTKRTMRSALTLFKAFQAKPELLRVAVGGLAGMAALLALQPFMRRRKLARQPEHHEKVATPVILRLEFIQSVIWISSRTVQIERFPAMLRRLLSEESQH